MTTTTKIDWRAALSAARDISERLTPDRVNWLIENEATHPMVARALRIVRDCYVPRNEEPAKINAPPTFYPRQAHSSKPWRRD